MSPLAQLAAYMVGAVLMRAVIAYADARLDVKPDAGHDFNVALCVILWPMSVVVFACIAVVEYAKRAGANARKRARR